MANENPMEPTEGNANILVGLDDATEIARIIIECITEGKEITWIMGETTFSHLQVDLIGHSVALYRDKTRQAELGIEQFTILDAIIVAMSKMQANILPGLKPHRVADYVDPNTGEVTIRTFKKTGSTDLFTGIDKKDVEAARRHYAKHIQRIREGKTEPEYLYLERILKISDMVAAQPDVDVTQIDITPFYIDGNREATINDQLIQSVKRAEWPDRINSFDIDLIAPFRAAITNYANYMAHHFGELAQQHFETSLVKPETKIISSTHPSVIRIAERSFRKLFPHITVLSEDLNALSPIFRLLTSISVNVSTSISINDVINEISETEWRLEYLKYFVYMWINYYYDNYPESLKAQICLRIVRELSNHELVEKIIAEFNSKPTSKNRLTDAIISITSKHEPLTAIPFNLMHQKNFDYWKNLVESES